MSSNIICLLCKKVKKCIKKSLLHCRDYDFKAKKKNKEVDNKCRCNNCMSVYDEDITECPKCKTDAYLMQPFLNSIQPKGKMNKILFFVIFVSMFLFTSNVFAISYGTVQDNNNGKLGDIFVNTGVDSGSTDIGSWTNADFLKGKKGDKGETGIAGLNGRDGIDGVNGQNGINGIDGLNGRDGIDGVNGQNGINGIDGLNGNNGRDGIDIDPITVLNLQNADILLQDDLNSEILNRINADTIIADMINSEIFTREEADNTLNNGLKKETRQRKQADKKINKRIDNEITNRINSDDNLQNNIDTVNTNSQDRDINLQNNINTVDNEQTTWNQKQDVKMKEFNNIIDNHSQILNNHEDRINKLEEAKILIEANIRVLDTRKTTIEIFNSYDVRHNANFATGVRFTFKMGKSYEEKLLEAQNARLERIEKELALRAIQTKIDEYENDIQLQGTNIVKTTKF